MLILPPLVQGRCQDLRLVHLCSSSISSACVPSGDTDSSFLHDKSLTAGKEQKTPYFRWEAVWDMQALLFPAVQEGQCCEKQLLTRRSLAVLSDEFT